MMFYGLKHLINALGFIFLFKNVKVDSQHWNSFLAKLYMLRDICQWTGRYLALVCLSAWEVHIAYPRYILMLKPGTLLYLFYGAGVTN